jgi:phosphatidylglycerol---prolipoprotein diacylglyceryl transferase
VPKVPKKPLRLIGPQLLKVPLQLGSRGNYFNQELFGRPSNLPWAIEIAPENRPPGFKDADTLHPTFFYEFVWDLLVGLLLL